MRAILDYCTGGAERQIKAGTNLVTAGGPSGHLYVLLEGRLEVLKGDMVVATIAEPGAVLGEMSVLLGLPHTATVRACSDTRVYEFEDAAAILKREPTLAILIARMLAQRLNAAAKAAALTSLTREAFSQLVTGEAGLRDVDLIIRTSGEKRLSDFLLWEGAYAELHFTERMWPEFDAGDLAAALASFHGRERRFGGLQAIVPEEVPSLSRV